MHPVCSSRNLIVVLGRLVTVRLPPGVCGSREAEGPKEGCYRAKDSNYRGCQVLGNAQIVGHRW